MPNLSKTRQERFWKIWGNSGAVKDSTEFCTVKNSSGLVVRSKADIIREDLIPALRNNKLDTKITFTTSALKEIYRISRGDWPQTKVYAGTAILDALQSKKNVIHYQDIRNVNIAEPIALMLGGKDVWDEIRYIGVSVPNMLPEGVQLGRLLNLLDANRTRNATQALEHGTLPQCLDVKGITYQEKGILGHPEVLVPFKYDPSHEEVGAVARNLANFVETVTNSPQDIRDITHGEGSLAYIQFFVQNKTQAERMFRFTSPNYRIAKESGPRVRISRETLCDENHKPDLLEKYVQSLKASNPK